MCVTDQPQLDGQYTIFGRVSEGMDIVQKISEAPASPDGRVESRLEIASVTIRDSPPPEPEPFAATTPAELGAYRAVLDTTAGPITIEFFANKAPEHVRNFLRLAQAGVFDGTAFHRVVRLPVKTGSLSSRALPEKQQKLVHQLQPEFNDEARQGHRLDGPRRRPGERDDAVLHRDWGRRSPDGKHGVRSSCGRPAPG